MDAAIADDPGDRPGLADAAGGAASLRFGPAADGELVARGRPESVAPVTLTSGSTGEPTGCARTCG
ncbi:hypothetical protein [Streptomyces sp. 6N223]|uniref:hypothetical protein n=1 Tax=Streptomyces sp. 6N223 TaxID=3457412 RepID=UPI003FCF3D1A